MISNLKNINNFNYSICFMKIRFKKMFTVICVIGIFTSCNTLEKASMHGLNSGFYKLKSDNNSAQHVYLDVANEQIDVYHHKKQQPDKKHFLTIPLNISDSIVFKKMVLKKQSLDVDITSILFKYRPSIYDLPAQVNTDLNIALYFGWRHDNYHIMTKKDPLGRNYNKINNLGYDFGLFAGPSATLISPFSTQNLKNYDYNGMIIQTGIAGFIESNVASFGLAIGYDYLLNPDRKIWIYNNKPWVGFVVGIALN